MSVVEFLEVTPPAIADLETRSLGSDEDRVAWLEARTGVITATEAKLLITAPSATARKRVIEDLIDEKLNGSKFSGNHFTYWGQLREPVILNQLQDRYGVKGCGLLVHAESNSLHAATPDGARVNFDGLLELAEIKTSKNDVRVGSSGFDRAGYFFQMQWQMYCTGADRVLYVVERHNNDWSGWDKSDRSTWRLDTGPKVEPIVSEWVARDDAVIDRMIEYADQALEALDAARSAKSSVSFEVDVPDEQSALEQRAYELGADVLAARVDESAAVKRKKLAWDQLLELGGRSGDFSVKGDAGSVRYIAPVAEMVDVPDNEAAVAEFPKEWASLERARKRVAKLEAEWAERAAGFTKQVEQVGKPSLSVTAPKKGRKS